MPQVVPDLLEAIASFEQMTGTGVSQPVRAIAFGGQAHDGKRAPHQTTQGPIRQSAVRGAYGEEEGAAMARWPAVAHVACNSIADARLERAHLKTHALGSLDPKTIVLPVDIVELQSPDLSRAQPIDREQQQHGAVAETGRLIPRGLVNHTADLVPGRSKGEALVPVDVGQEDRVGEARLCPALCCAEWEPISQAGGHVAQRRTTQPVGDVLEVNVHVADIDTCEITALLLQVSQEGHDLAAPDATRRFRLPPVLALLLDERLNPIL